MKNRFIIYLSCVILSLLTNCHTLELVDEDKCSAQNSANVGEIWYPSFIFGNFEKIDLIPETRDNRWCCNNSISKVKMEKSIGNVLFETLIGIVTVFIASPLIVNFQASEVYCECAKCQIPNHNHSGGSNYKVKPPENINLYRSPKELPYTPIETTRSVPPPPPVQQQPTIPNNFGKIYFDFDSANLTLESMRVVDGYIDTLYNNPKNTALINGYADQTGSINYNDKLAAKRADSVKNYMIGRGINPERITTNVIGSRSPIVYGKDEIALRENRVVIINIDGR